jgi:hypothetical protein
LRIVAHDKYAGLSQRAIEGLHTARRQTEKFLLAPGVGPCDRAAAFFPILRLC